MKRMSIRGPRRMFPFGFWDDEWDIADYPETEMDVYEENDNVIIKLKAPGFEEKNMDITIEDGVLTITGKSEKKEEDEDKDRKYYRKEISSQSFTRRVDLPVRVKAEKAEAVFKNGVLKLTLPKAEEAKPKSIKIEMKK